MSTIVEDYRSNLQTVLKSSLPVSKKQVILERMRGQLGILCNEEKIIELTENERTDLRIVHKEIEEAVYLFSRIYSP